MNIKVDNLFSKWACSFSGCEGGNRNAPVWVCGIEPGHPKKQTTDKYYDSVRSEILEGEVPDPVTPYNWDEQLSYPFGISVAKLLLAINGKNARDWENISAVADGNQQFEIFKLNLFPIPFKEDDEDLWTELQISEWTPFQNKKSYKDWCESYRFPVIRKRLHDMDPPPRLIIGVGIMHSDYFVSCFSGERNTKLQNGMIDPPADKKSQSPRSYYWMFINNGNTLLVIIPFFSGPSGTLNSDHLVQEMGERIRKLMERIGLQNNPIQGGREI